jgi:hypothetical protein
MATGNLGVGYIQALPRSISMVTAVKEFDIGSRVIYKGEEYVYVYAKTVTCPVGWGVVLSASTSYSVTITTVTDQDDAFVGVVKHVDIEKEEYGWVLTKGFAPVNAAGNTAIYIADRVQIVAASDTGNMGRVTSNANDTARVVRGVAVQSGITSNAATVYIYG